MKKKAFERFSQNWLYFGNECVSCNDHHSRCEECEFTLYFLGKFPYPEIGEENEEEENESKYN